MLGAAPNLEFDVSSPISASSHLQHFSHLALESNAINLPRPMTEHPGIPYKDPRTPPILPDRCSNRPRMNAR